MNEEGSGSLKHKQRTMGNQGMMRVGEIVFPREEHNN